MWVMEFFDLISIVIYNENVFSFMNLFFYGHKIGKRESLYSKMVLLYILRILLCAHPLKSNQMDKILNYEGGMNRIVIFN